MAFATGLFFRDRKWKRLPRGFGGNGDGKTQRHGQSPSTMLPMRQQRSPSERILLEDHLPQSLDDKTITTKVANVRMHIELHVDNFYQQRKIAGHELSKETLEAIGTDHLPRAAAVLLSKRRNQVSVIKHCLAYLIFSSTSLGKTAQGTFLPADLMSFAHKIMIHHDQDISTYS